MRNNANTSHARSSGKEFKASTTCNYRSSKIYLNRMQVKYFEKLGLEMWGYACLPRQSSETGRRCTGDHLQARDLPEN